MNALTLQWHNAGQEKRQQISDRQASKNPGTFRIGRDPLQCDIVLSDATVSRLHIEIFFNQQQQNFYIRNLKLGNPPLVDGQQLFHNSEMPLREGSIIRLGQNTEIKVETVATNAIAATIVAPPTPPNHHQHSVPTLRPGHHHHHSHTHPAQQQGVYGLECPKCHKVSSPEHIQVGCPWCGTSLAAAVSVLVAPER